jgi:hypothetical protein
VAGLGAGGVGRVAAEINTQPPPAGHFGRLFRLPPFATANPDVLTALLALGEPGGPMDAKDPLGAGPVRLITEPALSPNNRDNPALFAGTTFLGQFIDHDITLDQSSRLGTPTPPEQTPNGRTAALDLDSVYGPGSLGDLNLRAQGDEAKMRVESGGLFEDVPREASKRAILGDPRNDENVVISGMHAAFLLFHNKAVDGLRRGLAELSEPAEAAGRSAGIGGANRDLIARDPRLLFLAARLITAWHYQFVVLNEFLPKIVGQDVLNDVRSRRNRIYAPPRGQAYIPVEFQSAAYRFGHSMVRPSYRANLAGDNKAAFFGLIFDPAEEGKADPADLRGGARAPRRFVGWQTFFDFGDGEVKPSKLIDTRLSTPLFQLPLGTIGGGQPPTSLAQRNLLRHLTWELPSGQSIAQELRLPVLAARDLGELGGNLRRSTPLWFYVLKEAQVMADGQRLGPVGGRIVAEVLVGLLEADPTSFLSVLPSWRPRLPARSGSFGMVDFLTFAGVDPASRGQ